MFPDRLHLKSIKIVGSACQETISKITVTFKASRFDHGVQKGIYADQIPHDARQIAISGKDSKLFHRDITHSLAYSHEIFLARQWKISSLL